MSDHVDIILVTGSIALRDTPRSSAWALGTLALGFARRSPLLVVHGDAEGADRAADRAASAAFVPTLAFPAGGRAEWRVGLCDPPPEAVERVPLPTYEAHPLRRNDAMVAWCAGAKGAGASVLVVGLYAPWCARSSPGAAGRRTRRCTRRGRGSTW